MPDIIKVAIELSDGRHVAIRIDDLSNPLKKKLRKEAERFFTMKKVITEPIYNEER